MSAPTPPLQIAILGAGKVGSAFAFQLARTGGHEVTVIARPDSPRLAQLERDQAIIDVNGVGARVRVTRELDERAPYDLIIVTLLAHQVEPLLPALQRSAGGAIQFMFNTFSPERLQAAVGPRRCSFGMPFVQAQLDAEGRLKVAIGAAGQKTIMDQQRWVDVFVAAGLPAAMEPDMAPWLRCHAPVCVAFESVSVAGERRRGGASWTECLILARGVRASFALIKALGFAIYPGAKRTIKRNPAWVFAGVLWFMSRVRSLRELLASGKAEAEALVDAMILVAPPEFPPALSSRIWQMKPSSISGSDELRPVRIPSSR